MSIWFKRSVDGAFEGFLFIYSSNSSMKFSLITYGLFEFFDRWDGIFVGVFIFEE